MSTAFSGRTLVSMRILSRLSEKFMIYDKSYSTYHTSFPFQTSHKPCAIVGASPRLRALPRLPTRLDIEKSGKYIFIIILHSSGVLSETWKRLCFIPPIDLKCIENYTGKLIVKAPRGRRMKLNIATRGNHCCNLVSEGSKIVE